MNVERYWINLFNSKLFLDKTGDDPRFKDDPDRYAELTADEWARIWIANPGKKPETMPPSGPGYQFKMSKFQRLAALCGPMFSAPLAPQAPALQAPEPKGKPIPVQMLKLYAFYTVGTPYEVEAFECVRSFANFDVTVRPVPMPNQKNWMRNCMMRSQLLNSLARQDPGCPVGLVDADCRCIETPEKLFTFDECHDIALEHNPEAKQAHEFYAAGCVVFSASTAGRQALSNWANLCSEDESPKTFIREQVYLKGAIESVEGIKVLNLGREYNRIAKDRFDGDGSCIVNGQVSDAYIKDIGGRR